MKKLYLFMFLMLCCAQVAVSDVLNEGFELGTLPEGWTQEYVRTPITLNVDTADFSWQVESGDALQYPAGTVAGNGRVAARNASADEMRFVTRLITPPMNLTAVGVFRPQLLFSHAEPAYSGSADTLRLYYRANASDIWHAYPNCVYTNNAQWKNELIDIVAPSSSYQLAFEITENMGRGVVLDSIVVRSTPTCRPITDVAGLTVHAFDATIAWNEEGYYDFFDVLVTTARVTDFSAIDTATVVFRSQEVYNTELMLNNLTPETTYYIYVRSDCPENVTGFTDWAEGSIKTLAVAYLPYTQTFAQMDTYPGNVYFGRPHGWLNGATPSAVAPYVYKGTKSDCASYSNDSTAFLSFTGEQKLVGGPIAAGVYAYAVAPEAIVSSLQGVEVGFWATAHEKVSVGTAKYASSLIVGVMTEPADFATFEAVDTVHIESGYQFKYFTVSLDNYTGNGKYVALASRFDEANAMYVDNFSMKIPATLTPNHVKVRNVHVTGFDVEANLNGADSWNLMVSTEYNATGDVPAASIVYSANNLTAPAVQVVKADSSFANQVLMVYVQAVKNGVASAWSFPVTLRVPSHMRVPYLNACDAQSGTISLISLNNEIRAAKTLQGLSSVYYPLAGISTDIKNYPMVESTRPNYSGAHARLEGVDSWFVLPEVDDLTNLKMIFRYATLAGVRGKMEVGVMTDPYDLATFENLATFTTVSEEYRRALVSFDAYEGTGKYIAFRSINANIPDKGSVMLLDQIQVEELGSCREASNVVARVKATSAEISWNGGGMDGWIVGLSTSRQMLTVTYDTVYQPNYKFNNLEPEHTYYYTIQTICGDSLLDLDEVYYEFTTPMGLPFVEKFANSNLPAGWTRASGTLQNAFGGSALSSSSSGWNLTSSSSFVLAPQSGYAAYMNLYSTNNYWLISPALTLPEDADQLGLSFDLGVHGYSGSTAAGQDDVVGVLVSLDGGTSWNRANATLWTNDGTGDFVLNDLTWESAEHIEIDFSRYAGQSIKFAFFGGSTIANADNYISIDNVSLHVVDERCGGVSNLSVLSNAADSTVLSWNVGGVNPYPTFVQVCENRSFANCLYSDSTEATSITLTNLTHSTHYYVRARQLCPAGSDWVESSFNTACQSISPEDLGTINFSDATALDCWQVGFAYPNGTGTLPVCVNDNSFGRVLSITKSAVGETASDGAYAITPQLNIPDSLNHYQVVFRAGTVAKDATNVGRIKVGIVSDPSDAASSFSEAASLRLAPASDSLSLKTYVVSFEDYTGDLFGEYGRYIMFLSETGNDSTNYVYIDNVLVEPAQSCRMVLNLDCDTTTEETAHLTWEALADSYELMLTNYFADADTVTNPLFRDVVSGGEYLFENLMPNTSYFAFIRTICAGDTSRWSSPTYFRTRYGIFFESWDDKSSISAAGWSMSNYRMGNNAFAGTALSSANTTWSLTTRTEGLMNDKVARFNVYGEGTTNSGHAWLITPSINLTQVNSGAMFSFNVAVYPYSSGGGASASTDKALYVLVSEDDGATWNPAKATKWTCDGRGDYDFRSLTEAGKKFNIDLSSYVGKTVKIGFYGQSLGTSTDLYYAIDSVGVAKYIAQCLGVRNLAVELTSDSTAKATWRNISIPNETKVELASDAAFTNVLAIDTVLDAEETTFRGLLPNLTYYVRAMQLCGGAEYVVTSFNTPKAIPFEETFSGTVIPAGWEQYQGNVQDAFDGTLPQPSTNASWKMNSGLYGFINKQAANNEYWLISPDIVLNDASSDDIKLFFDLALTLHNSANAPSAATQTDGIEFRVMVSTDNGESWTEDQNWLFCNSGNAFMPLSDLTAEPQRMALDMSDYRGQRVRVAFYKGIDAASNNSADLHIANFQIRVVGEECDAPANLAVSETSFTTTHLSWDGEDDVVTLIQWATLADFSNAVSDTVISGTTYDIANLTPATTYYVRARHLCGSNSMSDFTDIVEFTTSLGLPYSEALKNRDNWSAFTTTGGVPAVDAELTASTSLTGWRANTTTAILGVNHIACAHNTSSFWMVSPEIDLTPNTTESVIAMSLDLALTAGATKNEAPAASAIAGKRFYVMVSTDNGATWPLENRFKWSDDADATFGFASIPAGEGYNYQMDITRFGGEKIRVALVLEGSTKKSFAMHAANFELYALASNCFGVSNIIVNHVDTAAQVTVTPQDNATQWEVAYGLTGGDVTTMPTVIGDSVAITFGGLALNSTYDVYARSICAEGDTSSWYGPISFDTPIGLTYAAPFRNSFSGWNRFTGDPAAIFAGDTTLVAATSTTTGWMATNSVAVLGEQHIYAAKEARTTNWLVSPVVNLMPQAGTTESIYLSLDLALTSSSASAQSPTITTGNTFRIAISEDAGQTWSAEHSILFGDTTADYLYSSIPAGKGRSFHFDVTEYAGKEICVALVMGAANNNSLSTIHVNDFELAQYAVPCFGVADLTVIYDNGMAQCTILPGDSAVQWQYVFGNRGFVPSDENAVTIDSLAFNVAVPMSSQLDFYVRSICGAADTSVWYGPVPLLTPYGVRYEESLSGAAFPTGWSEYAYSSTGFSAVTSSNLWYVGGGKNSYAWNANHAYINAYSTRKELLASPEIDLSSSHGNMTMLTFDMALTKYNQSNPPTDVSGQSFEVRVSTDNGKSWGDVVAVWSDENRADFPYSGIPTTGETYTVDLTDYVGEKIRVGFYSISSGITGVDNDLHIRNVVIDTISGSMCTPVRSMRQLDATFTSVTVAFRAAGIDDAAEIQYICLPQNSFFNAKKAVSADTSVVTITGLMSSMNYDVYARVMCADSSWTAWTGPFLAATVECSPVTGILSYNLTMETADITLAATDAMAAAGYQLVLTDRGGLLDETMAIESNSPSFQFAYNFTELTKYDVYARKICQAGDTSEWTGPFSITSPIANIGDALVNESFSGSSLPNGWTRYSTSNSTVPTPQNAFSSSTSGWSVGSAKNSYAFGENHAYINIYSTNKYILATPQIDLSATNHSGAVLMFDLALTKYGQAVVPTSVTGQRFEIRVSSDNGATWELVESWCETGGDHVFASIPNGDGETFTVDLSDYVGQQIRVGFYSCATTSGADNDLHLRNVLVVPAGTQREEKECQPVDVTLLKAGLNSASFAISYRDSIYATRCYYELATDYEFTNVIAADTVYGNALVVSNLQPTTTYYIHAKNICAGDDESRYSAKLSFTTARGLPYAENFDDGNFPADWTRMSGLASDVFQGGSLTTTTSGWSISTSAMSTPCVRGNVYGTSWKYWAITPTIDLDGANGDVILAFDVAKTVYNSSYTSAAIDDKFMVIVSTDGGATWLESNAFVWDNNSRNTSMRRQGSYDNDITPTPQRVVLDFNSFVGQSVTIAFYGESTISNGDNYVMFDNVLLTASRVFNVEDTICSGVEYEDYGFYLAPYSLEEGLQQLSRTSPMMDSIVNLSLFVRQSYEIQLTDTICEGEIYNLHGYNFTASTSDVHRRRLTAVNGCDSLISLDLTVLPVHRTTEERYACMGSSYELLGKFYYGDVVVRDTTSSVVTGCDSIVTYYVNFSDQSEYRNVTRIALCAGDGYMVNDSLTLTEPGTYVYELSSRGGCDSTIVVELLAMDIAGNIYDTIRVEDLPYEYNGRTMLKQVNNDVWDYSYNVLTSCGSNGHLYLHVIPDNTALDDLYSKKRLVHKELIDGHIFIIVEDQRYDATGRLVDTLR